MKKGILHLITGLCFIVKPSVSNHSKFQALKVVAYRGWSFMRVQRTILDQNFALLVRIWYLQSYTHSVRDGGGRGILTELYIGNPKRYLSLNIFAKKNRHQNFLRKKNQDLNIYSIKQTLQKT